MEDLTAKIPMHATSKIKPSKTDHPSRLDGFIRRGFDIAAAFFGLIALSPVFLLIAWLIKRDSPGPVFYRGWRVGRGGRRFKILKFRTMYECAESYNGPKITSQDDPRITMVGQWLRDTKLNELPQLWNVLKGEMSLVGPRPEDPEIVAGWPEEARQVLLSVRPGLTSPASIIYRDEASLLRSSNLMEDYLRTILPSKLRLDTLYLRSRSVLSDLDVVFWTLLVLLPNIRRRPIPTHRIYWGPLARFFQLDFPWFLLDVAVAFGSVGVSGLLWRSSGPLDLGLGKAVGIAFIIALLFSGANAVLGANRVYWAKARPADALDLALASGVVIGVLLAVDFFFVPASLLPTGMVLMSGVLMFMGSFVLRYRERIITGVAARWLGLRGGVHQVGERVLIVGAGELGEFALWLTRKGDLARAFSVVGLVDDDPHKVGMRIEGGKVLGTTQSIPELVTRHDVGLLLFAISNIHPQEQERILNLCGQTSARLVMIPNIMQVMRAHFRVGSLKVAGTDGRQGLPDIPGMIQAQKVHAWMEELESLLRSGDYQESLTKIAQIKAALDGDK